ncbi:MAG TPA: GNAT family N-acetyltransferase [Longimicrobiales bacterium]|nr:GNAT family N-acetyltransferase [Longimicrobiales bacterium]
MSDVVIRPLQGMQEYRACEALQREVWGQHFRDLVPGSVQQVTQELGGVVSGAFHDGRLVGFVFGMTGLREGRLTHWSDMLAVTATHRGTGLGRRLKLHQREVLLERGVRHMLWTFDPLVARNAYLNLSVLGTTVREYRRDVYGETDSPLHDGLGTDRLLAEWDLDSDRVRDHIQRDGPPPPPDPAPLVNPPDTSGPLPRAGAVEIPAGERRIAVAVPADIMSLKARAPDVAREWRFNVRQAMESAFSEGYMAVQAGRLDDALSAYTLIRGS